jgi:hypothetical protein
MLDTDYNGPVFMARQVFFPKTEAWNNLDQPYPSALLLGHPGGQEAMTERVLAMAEQAVSQGAEIEVRRFAA